MSTGGIGNTPSNRASSTRTIPSPGVGHAPSRRPTPRPLATHYFELTDLPKTLDGIANVHVEAREHAGGLVFLYGVRAGPARQSYGLEVARLAGVPERIITRARGYLQELEADHHHPPVAQADLFTAPPSAPPTPDRLRERLTDIDPDTLSPRSAHALIYELLQLLK